MKRVVEMQKKTTIDDPDIPSYDLRFHTTIGRASGNRLLEAFIAAVHDATHPAQFLDVTQRGRAKDRPAAHRDRRRDRGQRPRHGRRGDARAPGLRAALLPQGTRREFCAVLVAITPVCRTCSSPS